MYAAPVGRVAYWVVRNGGLRRVPVDVLSSARRTSQAWRAWGNRLAGVIGRTFGAGAAAGVGGLGVSKMPMKRRMPYAERTRAMARSQAARGPKRQRVTSRRSRMPAQALPNRINTVRRRRAMRGQRAPALYRRNTQRTKSRLTRRRVRVKPSLNVPYEVARLQGVKTELPDRDPNDALPQYPGFYPISRGDPSGATGMLTPVYIADLTVVNQTSDSVASRNAFRRLQIDDDGSVTFVVSGSQIPSGTTIATSNWQRENSRNLPIATDGFYPMCQHQWYDIRLKLYGARKQSVSYDVMLVRFTTKELCPEEPESIPGTADEGLRRHFYQMLVKNACANTILPQRSMVTRGVRILKRRKITLAASNADDLETIPENVDLKWFVRDSRVLRYKEGAIVHGTDGSMIDTSWVTQDTSLTAGQITARPYHRARTYLIVRATDMTGPVGSDDMDDSPSFDMCLRRKTHYYLG